MSMPQIPAAGRAGPPLLGIASFVVIVAGISMASTIVSMVLLSILVTILITPIAGWVRKRGGPGWLALGAALASYVAALAAVAVIAAIGLVRLLDDVPSDATELANMITATVGESGFAETVATAFRSFATDFAKSALSGLAVIGYSVIIVAYLLIEAPTARTRILWAFPGSTEIVGRATDLAIRLRAYLIARAALGLLAAVLDTAVLLIVGVPSAFLWGLLAFLMSFVPNVGFIISVIPPAILAFVVGGVPTTVIVIVAYTIINVATDYLVQPRFVGSAVDLSPVVVTVSLLFWVVVLGGAGAIFAVPLTIIVAAVADAFEPSRPVSRMLVSRVPMNPATDGPTPDPASPTA
jgi:predicted PurR-regulated permease PerM